MTCNHRLPLVTQRYAGFGSNEWIESSCVSVLYKRVIVTKIQV